MKTINLCGEGEVAEKGLRKKKKEAYIGRKRKVHPGV